VPYIHAEWAPATDDAAVATVLSRAGRLGPHSDIVVPAIPALDIARSAGPDPDAAAAADVATVSATWPEALRTAVIKGKPGVAPPAPGVVKAVASGVRSCVVKTERGWFRLKGSGNNDEGFIVKETKLGGAANAEAEDTTRQIRGCAWLHTAIRENHIAATLAAALEVEGVTGANGAQGAFVYGPPNQPFGPDVSVPACVVTSTVGDRRLGTHVLAGIELLLPLLLDVDAMDEAVLRDALPEARRALPGLSDPVVATATLMTDHMLAFEFASSGILPPGSRGLDFNVPRDATVMADGSKVALPHNRLEVGTYPQQWTADGPTEMAARWRPLWDACVTEYNDALEVVGDRSVLGYLFSRLGRDCGRVLKGLHSARISWGTYQDELCIDPSQWHCNAHANNVVVLPPDSGSDSYLAYLDLDMAFDDKTFVSLYGKGSPKGTVGTSAADHDHLLLREHVNFMEVLAGSDTTSGVPMVAKTLVEKYPDVLKIAKSLLYDGLILGYKAMYEGPSPLHPVAAHDADLHRAGHAAIKLAIIVMADFIA